MLTRNMKAYIAAWAVILAALGTTMGVMIKQNSPVCGSNNAYCSLNFDVSQATIHSTICVPGWTASIRPPTSYTEPIKLEMLAAGQNTVNGDTNPKDYELDHRMPLELGGAPSDLQNLSIESPASPNEKDKDENAYKRLVCSDKLSLRDAQQQLVGKWLSQYPSYRR